MTTTLEARDAIVKRWLANWSESDAVTVLQGEVSRPDRGTPYVLLTVSHTTSGQETIGAVGNRNFLRAGNIIATIHVPTKNGTKLADTLAQSARAIFEATSFDGVDVYAAEVNELGSDGEWLVWTVVAPFNYQERK